MQKLIVAESVNRSFQMRWLITGCLSGSTHFALDPGSLDDTFFSGAIRLKFKLYGNGEKKD